MIDPVSVQNYYYLMGELNKREVLVFKALLSLGRATSWEVEDYLFKNGKLVNPHNPNFVRPRLTDLKVKGLILKSHLVRVSGITQWVWRVKESYATIQQELIRDGNNE